jgi:hypothetical protein
MAASENSATEHDRLREAITDIKAEAHETRDAVRGLGKTMGDLREVILGWKGDVEARLVGITMRLESLEKSAGGREKSITDRVNVVLNALAVALVLWTLYKVTGIKAP